VIALALLACAGSDPAPSAVEHPEDYPHGVPTLVYTHNVDGEIEPCG
jgi:hypothetical protein